MNWNRGIVKTKTSAMLCAIIFSMLGCSTEPTVVDSKQAIAGAWMLDAGNGTVKEFYWFSSDGIFRQFNVDGLPPAIGGHVVADEGWWLLKDGLLTLVTKAIHSNQRPLPPKPSDEVRSVIQVSFINNNLMKLSNGTSGGHLLFKRPSSEYLDYIHANRLDGNFDDSKAVDINSVK